MYEHRMFPVINLEKTGSAIESCRRAAGLTVRDVQAYFGFEYPQAIYKWQHGECLPTVDNLLALAKLLGVSMEDLLVVDDQEIPLFLGLFSMRLFLRKNAHAGIWGTGIFVILLFALPGRRLPPPFLLPPPIPLIGAEASCRPYR